MADSEVNKKAVLDIYINSAESAETLRMRWEIRLTQISPWEYHYGGMECYRIFDCIVQEQNSDENVSLHKAQSG